MFARVYVRNPVRVLTYTNHWKMIIGDLNPENPVYAVEKKLRSHIKIATEKVCGYKLKDIRFLHQAVEMNVVTILKMRLLKCVFIVQIQQEGYIETQTPQ